MHNVWLIWQVFGGTSNKTKGDYSHWKYSWHHSKLRKLHVLCTCMCIWHVHGYTVHVHVHVGTWTYTYTLRALFKHTVHELMYELFSFRRRASLIAMYTTAPTKCTRPESCRTACEWPNTLYINVPCTVAPYVLFPTLCTVYMNMAQWLGARFNGLFITSCTSM